MVFGWGKKDREPVQDASRYEPVALGDVSGVLDELDAKRSSRAVSEVGEIRDRTASMLASLKELGSVLEKEDLSVDDIDRHLALIVVRGKKQVIEIIKKAVVPLPAVHSVQTAAEMESALDSILKKVGFVLGRQSKVIHHYAKRHVGRLKSDLEQMTSNHKEIRRILDDHAEMKAKAEEIAGLVSQIGAIRDHAAEAERRIHSMQNDAESRKGAIREIRQKISDIESSEAYRRHTQLEESLESLAGRRSRSRSQINAMFARISRPLGRYEYGSALDREQKKTLSQLVSDPFGALLASDRSLISEILENVQNGVRSGSISVKDSGKTLAQISEIAGSLDESIGEALAIAAEEKRINGEMRATRPAGLDQLRESLEKNVLFNRDSEIRIRSIREETSESESRIPKMVEEIETLLRNLSGTRYIVQGGSE